MGNIGFPGQFRKFVIQFDEGVIQIREINLRHENRSSNLYFGHSNSHFGQEILRLHHSNSNTRRVHSNSPPCREASFRAFKFARGHSKS